MDLAWCRICSARKRPSAMKTSFWLVRSKFRASSRYLPRAGGHLFSSYTNANSGSTGGRDSNSNSNNNENRMEIIKASAGSESFITGN